MVTLDETDVAMLRTLAGNGRMSIADLAQRVSVSRATAYNRLGRLVDSGVIRRFTVDIDPAAIGLPVTALVLMDVDQTKWPNLRRAFTDLGAVQFAGLAAGTYDVVALVRAPDMISIRDVVLRQLLSIPETRRTQTTFVLEELVDRPTMLPPDEAT